MKKVLIFTILCSFWRIEVKAQQLPVVAKGHAHNDYAHKRPLFDALDNGFASVEADIFWVGNKFIVAHTKLGIKEKNTLKKLYLEPLQTIVSKNNGKVYQEGLDEFVLMIDLKGDWSVDDLKALESYVLPYAHLFTYYQDGQKHPGPVRILLSGAANALVKEIAGLNPRYFSVDGRFSDFDSKYGPEIIPRTSSNYRSLFAWKGFGKMPADQKQILHEFVVKAQMNNRKIRFWATPDRKKLWKELLDAGVDWVNVDKLEKFRKYYLKYEGDKGKRIKDKGKRQKDKGKRQDDQ